MQGERMALMEYIVGTPFSQTDCAGYLDSDTHPGLQVSWLSWAIVHIAYMIYKSKSPGTHSPSLAQASMQSHVT